MHEALNLVVSAKIHASLHIQPSVEMISRLTNNIYEFYVLTVCPLTICEALMEDEFRSINKSTKLDYLGSGRLRIKRQNILLKTTIAMN